MMGTIAKVMMQRMVRAAGDAVVEDIVLRSLGEATYNASTGQTDTVETIHTIGSGLMGAVTESERIRYKLTTTTHKLRIARLDIDAIGAPLPKTHDKMVADAREWHVDRVHSDAMRAGVIVFLS